MLAFSYLSLVSMFLAPSKAEPVDLKIKKKKRKRKEGKDLSPLS